MQKLDFKTAVITCAFAGGAAFLLLCTMMFGMPLALLAFMRPLPLFLVGLKYGSIATFLAGVFAVIITHLVFSPPQGFITFFMLAFPCFAIMQIASRALIINRLEPRFEPVGIMLMFTSLIGVVLAYSTIFSLFGFDYHAYETMVKETSLKALETFRTDLPVAEITGFIPTLIPLVAVVLWFITMIGNLYLASKLAPRFGLKMPLLDLQNIRLPFLSVLLMGIGFGMTYASGFIRLSGFILIASLIVPFTLQGLAVIHSKTRGKSWRMGFLIAFYLIAVFSGWTFILAFLVGLADPAFIFRKPNGEK
jgi:hypothetical protein